MLIGDVGVTLSKTTRVYSLCFQEKLSRLMVLKISHEILRLSQEVERYVNTERDGSIETHASARYRPGNE